MTPQFFMPDAPAWLTKEAAATPETTYEALAMLAGCQPLQLGERIYSVSWEHDGEECVARVGSSIRTTRPPTARRQGAQRTYRSTVLAVFRQGSERVILTSRDPRMQWHDDWDNPLRYIRPTDEELFAGPEGTPGAREAR